MGACVRRNLAYTTALLMAVSLSACLQGTGQDDPIRLSGHTMGTDYMVKIPGIPAGLGREDLHARIKEILERINGRMSTYEEDSELSLFNNNHTTDWVDVSAETALVVQEALRISRLTGGAFDITVGPLVNLWGFGPAPQQGQLPGKDAIRAAMTTVGYHRLHLRDSPPALRKDQPAIQIDLSAIAKGYAVDAVAEYLDSVQVSSYLVEIGGELRAKGEKAERVAWKVAVERPVPEGRRVLRTLFLRNSAMATSGDYRNFFEKDGQRFSHTINPRTGQPITHNLASVTVLRASCMEADAWTTGLLVLGPEDGYELATREKLPALFVTRGANGFEQYATAEFDRFLEN